MAKVYKIAKFNGLFLLLKMSKIEVLLFLQFKKPENRIDSWKKRSSWQVCNRNSTLNAWINAKVQHMR